MGEWQDRQVGYGAICSVMLWVSGVALIGAAIVGLVPDPCASLGNVLFMIGSLRTLLAVIRAQERRVSRAFELGREAGALQLIRD